MMDPTARADAIAARMRDFYEANKPLRWWQRRRQWDEVYADSLMLGLLAVVQQAEGEMP